jgi:hypothetical protein
MKEKKTFVSNKRKISELKNSFKKGFKKICENEKDDYFCTRNTADVL